MSISRIRGYHAFVSLAPFKRLRTWKDRQMKIPLAALFCLVAGAAAASPIEHLTRDKRSPETCALTVEFVSICCGPDRDLKERIELAVIADPRIARAYQWPWGMEGETTLCLVIRRKIDARRIAARFEAWSAASPNPTLTQVRRGPKLHH